MHDIKEMRSQRVMELIRRFESGLVDAVQMLKEAEELSKDIIKEDNAYKKSGLNKKCNPSPAPFRVTALISRIMIMTNNNGINILE